MKVFLLIISLVFGVQSFAQTTTAYYWFDTQEIGAAQSFSYNSNSDFFITTSGLSLGYHTMFIYFEAPDGSRSSIISSDFFKVSVNGGVTGAEYWFDGNLSTKKNILVASLNDFVNEIDISTDGLSIGEHSLSVRFLQAGGIWSAINSFSFFKATQSGGVSGVEYWFDEDIANRKSIIGNPQNFSASSVDASSLGIGFHTLNLRYLNGGGVWSTVMSSSFFKREASANSTNRLRMLRYWFDDRLDQAKETILIAGSFDDIISLKDCERISEGRHLFSFQVQDAYGIWGSVVSDSFTRFPIGYKEMIFPKLSTSKSKFLVTEPILYTGKDFQSGGYATVFLKEVVTGLTVFESVELVNQEGELNGSFNLDPSWRKGAYILGTRDLSSSGTSNEVKIFVDKVSSGDFRLLSPIAGSFVYERQPLQVSFQRSIDDYDKFVPLLNTGTSSHVYRGEYSSDNGLNWKVFESGVVKRDNLGINTHSFQKSFYPPSAGNYLFRITDLTTGDICESEYITVSPDPLSSPNYAINLVWDKAGFGKSKVDMPEGLAADSVSRIIINLKRKDGFVKPVNKISVEILPEGYSASDSRLLGRVSPASVIENYSNEADLPGPNNATSHSIDYFPLGFANDYNFWLCAPVDFARDLDDFSSERFIKVKFTVTYADNTSESFERGRIKIVRPPLMMVHGLGGDKRTFEETEYDLAGAPVYFKNSNLWKEKILAELSPSDNFDFNAKVLLGYQADKRYYNSIPDLIRRLRDQGIACSRVDYVAHSMGGSVARRMIEYNQYWNYNLKNYNRGLINKFITVNTPHQGSPVADLIIDLVADYYNTSAQEIVNQMAKPSTTGKIKISAELALQLFTSANVLKSALNGEQAKLPDYLDEFLRIDQTSGSSLFTILPTDAVKDLQSLNGGYEHKESWVKNSMIGGRIIDVPGVSGVLAERLNAINPLGGPIDYQKLYNNDLFEGLEFLYNVMDKLDALDPSIKTIKGVGDKILAIVRGFNFLYGIDFILDSDGIVPVTSQMGGESVSHNYNEPDELKAALSRTIAYSDRALSVNPLLWQANHVSTKSWIKTGNRIMVLLNAPLNSGFFANVIPASPVQNRLATSKTNNTQTSEKRTGNFDSVFVRFDTTHVKFIYPLMDDTVAVGKKIRAHVFVADTTGLKGVRVFLQSRIFTSDSKVAHQFFDFQCEPDNAGNSSILVQAVYDSAGFTVVHSDYANIFLDDSTLVQSIYLPRQRFYINPAQILVIPVYKGSDSAAVSLSYDRVVINIADQSVIKFDSVNNRFVAGDSGTTHIIFRNGLLSDTAFVYISQPLDVDAVPTCDRSLVKVGVVPVANALYSWELDQGSGFTGLSIGSNYFDINRDTLIVINPPNSFSQYKYRCRIDSNGVIRYSAVYKLGLVSTWSGQLGTDWNNPANWECGHLPDEFSDVVIPGFKTNYPEVSTNVTINSLSIQSNAQVTVKNGKMIDLKSKN